MSDSNTTPLIAVVEDEEHIAQGLLFNLEAEGYRVHHEADGDAALAWLLEHASELSAVVLDVMLPGMDGFSIARALRDAGWYVPVLMLTARGRTEDIVQGFAAGADDYLPKPFDLNVLLARLHALMRRVQWQRTPLHPQTDAAIDEQPVRLGEREIDLAGLEIRGGEQVVHMTVMEADLLRYLLERPNKVIARKDLLENVWHVHEDTDTRAIDNFIVRLRRYLEPDPANPRFLITVRGVGYRFAPEFSA
ncbi:response regulator transcription factor [Granulicella cerasi]|uniref:Response regulator transcription factor n=1 Tax=Granulicella cerasi TaxID=741063 RepID=A0ABW1ZCW6_9BACT|nr:response regulator transcription factor [Granulicella cerasi]